MRNISIEDLKSVIEYYLDTADENLIDNYTHKLLDLARDFDDGVRHTRPTVEFNGKTYYGKKLEIKNGVLFIDGVEIKEHKIEYSGDVVIENNDTDEKVVLIKITGDLKAGVINNAGGISCDSIHADEIHVGAGLHCDDVFCTSINATDVFAENITAKTIQVNGNLRCDTLKADNLLRPEK